MEMAERCSAIVALGKCAIGMMLEPESMVRPAFRHLHDLDDLLGALVERSKEQGWHGPIVDQIHHQAVAGAAGSLVDLIFSGTPSARRDSICRKANALGFRAGLAIYGLSLLVQLLSEI